MILIADSGSTKTNWVTIKDKTIIKRHTTTGLNPFFIDKETIPAHLKLFDNRKEIETIYFYGAGCVDNERKNIIKTGLTKVFDKAKIVVNDDITAAGRALYKNKQGIVAILGTGMSIGIYNGKNIIDKGTSLGYILGDEGSGADIGKKIIKSILYNELPEHIIKDFYNQYKTYKNDILQSVYQSEFPNKYIASFSQFAAKHIKNEQIEDIIENCFDSFFLKHVSKIKNYKSYKIRLSGSVAHSFSRQLKNVALKYKLQVDKIIKSPIDELIKFHI